MVYHDYFVIISQIFVIISLLFMIHWIAILITNIHDNYCIFLWNIVNIHDSFTIISDNDHIYSHFLLHLFTIYHEYIMNVCNNIFFLMSYQGFHIFFYFPDMFLESRLFLLIILARRKHFLFFYNEITVCGCKFIFTKSYHAPLAHTHYGLSSIKFPLWYQQ